MNLEIGSNSVVDRSLFGVGMETVAVIVIVARDGHGTPWAKHQKKYADTGKMPVLS